MDYDTREIMPDEYSNREERPRVKRWDFVELTKKPKAEKGTANGETIHRPRRV